MLALILAATVALASLIFFFSAFFAPKLHRQDDFFWSGVGLFYALVLWVCAQRLTGGVLLGQLAAVALILGFAWQTLKLRSALANSAVPLESPGFSFLGWLQGGRRQATKVGAPTPAPAVVEPVVPAAPEPPEIPPAPTVEVNVPETPSA
ncbi:MAG: Ycf66 family protein, partial [Cyanobacteriota bacterium]